MKKAIEFELALVNFSADEMIRRNPERGNNRFQLWQLSDLFPDVNFNIFYNSTNRIYLVVINIIS